MAAMAEVRDFVNGMLRAAAREGGVVLDGRDIGTVVFPDAEVKVFLVADAAERARRRLLERGRPPDAGTVRAEEAAPDAAGRLRRRRDVAPLVRAHRRRAPRYDPLSFEEQVRRVVDLVRQRFPLLDRPPAAGKLKGSRDLRMRVQRFLFPR